MKQYFIKGLTFLLVLVSGCARGDEAKPIKWTFSQKQLNDSEYTISCNVTIDKGWHVYSQFTGPGPVPLQFTYDSSKNYVLDGKTAEVGNAEHKYEKAFGDTVIYFEGSALFNQKIIVRNYAGFTLKGNLYYQTCNDSMCLRPTQVDFSFTIPKVEKPSHGGFWAIFFAGFGGGLLALITPCVFPMLPLTVSFFTKRSTNKKKGKRNAFIYASCIILIYVLLGLIITAVFGRDALKNIASNEWVNLVFFSIFVIFGFSLLGAFELVLPSSWVNKTDSASDRGGLVGIFFMALTLCIVSFSCTAPIVGSLLVGASQSGNYWSLTIGMLGFSLALALPFALFAAFPGWLNSLPQSGGWLNSVKVVMGLLELAFSLKFLSNADLIGFHIKWLHWSTNAPVGILKREVFIALWIVLFAVMGFYLLGKLKFHHDSDIKHVSVARLMFAVIAFGFVMYLIPGLFGAPLKLIGGFPPPDSNSEHWSLGMANSGGAGNSSNTNGVANTSTEQKMDCPLGINCFHDYDSAMAYARTVNKPVMIDFTGFNCVNCRNEEQDVWPDAEVLKILKNDVVLVSLYADDRHELPASLKYTSKGGDKVETWGDKWSDFEANRFGTVAMPFYAVVDQDGKDLVAPRGYTPDKDVYLQFLKEGVGNYHPASGKAPVTITH